MRPLLLQCSQDRMCAVRRSRAETEVGSGQRFRATRRLAHEQFFLDQFLEACGATGPLHLTVDRGSVTDNYVLPQPFALIGSDPRADLRVADSRIPRQGAFLQVLGGRLLALDLTPDAADRNGSYPPHHWLSPGQPWQFGGLTIRLGANASGDADTKALSRRDELPAAALAITGGSGGVCEYSLKAPIVLIGKSPKCQVRLRPGSVAIPSALIRTPAGLWAVDLLGRAGITVNGRVARAARMEDGDELRVGGFALRSRRSIGPSAMPRRRNSWCVYRRRSRPRPIGWPPCPMHSGPCRRITWTGRVGARRASTANGRAASADDDQHVRLFSADAKRSDANDSGGIRANPAADRRSDFSQGDHSGVAGGGGSGPPRSRGPIGSS